MLKLYVWRGLTWQFEEGSQPAGAMEVAKEMDCSIPVKKADKPANKAKTVPKNKAR